MENLTPKTRLEYYLDKIAQNSGGGDTPSGDFFPIHISWSNQEYTADKTFAEIQQAAQDGLAPYAIYNGRIYFLMDDIISTNTRTMLPAVFGSTPDFNYSGGEVSSISIRQSHFIITSNEITFDTQSYPQSN